MVHFLGVGFGGAPCFAKRITHEDVREIDFYGSRNASRHPVGDPLLSVLFVPEQLRNLRRAAQFEDEFFVFHNHIKHCVDYLVNTVFNSDLHKLFMLTR